MMTKYYSSGLIGGGKAQRTFSFSRKHTYIQETRSWNGVHPWSECLHAAVYLLINANEQNVIRWKIMAFFAGSNFQWLFAIISTWHLLPSAVCFERSSRDAEPQFPLFTMFPHVPVMLVIPYKCIPSAPPIIPVAWVSLASFDGTRTLSDYADSLWAHHREAHKAFQPWALFLYTHFQLWRLGFDFTVMLTAFTEPQLLHGARTSHNMRHVALPLTE